MRRRRKALVWFWRCLPLVAVLLGIPLLHAEQEAAPGADHLVKGSDVPVVLRGVSKDMLSSVDDVVTTQVGLAGDKAASTPLADDLAFFVRHHYLEQGFLLADVGWQIEGKDIVLVVDEGVRQHVGKVTFEGNPGLDEKELERYLLRPTRERIGSFATTTPFVQKEVNDGSLLVLRYVLSQGYVDATVDPPVPTDNADGTTDIKVVIHPREQWHIGTVQVTGEPPLLEGLTGPEAVALQGQPLNEARVENVRREVEGAIQTHGYFSAKASSTSTRAAKQIMNIQYTAVPGPLFHVTKVQLAPGFTRGASRVVRTAFKPAIGHKYDAASMEAEYNRVIDTGIFEHLDMEPKIAGEGELALDFTGEQAKRVSLGLSAGYDTFLGATLGVEYKNVNWMDSGNALSAKVIATQLGLQAGIQWKNPAIFDSPYSLSLGIIPETFQFEGYTRYSLAERAAVSRRFSKRLTLEAYVQASTSSVKSSTLTEGEIGPSSYSAELGGISAVYEARDNPASPTRGWYAKGTLESGAVSGGLSSLSYTHADFAASYYQPLGGKWHAAAGLRYADVISSQGVEFVPVELRLYNGGANGVRSFPERGLGPVAKDGTHLGGDQSETLSAEISYEVIKSLDIATFGDAGSLQSSLPSAVPFFNGVHYAGGLGLRYRLPFGPWRVDYGLNLNKHPGEPVGAVHIGFGVAF